MTDISIILTAHREGVMAGATARGALEAIERVEGDGATTQVIVVADRSDDLTKQVLANAFGPRAHVVETDHGDPGLSRNTGIAEATGTFATFLDADDLWSENWLSAAWQAATLRPEVIWHSHCNIVFGQERNFWWHVDSEGPLFDPDYLDWANYWDSMTFAATGIYRNLPFRANDLDAGFAHEDWHWNVLSIRNGIPHKPVLETVHFKRRRAGSQMSVVNRNDAMSIWPD